MRKLIFLLFVFAGLILSSCGDNNGGDKRVSGDKGLTLEVVYVEEIMGEGGYYVLTFEDAKYGEEGDTLVMEMSITPPSVNGMAMPPAGTYYLNGEEDEEFVIDYFRTDIKSEDVPVVVPEEPYEALQKIADASDALSAYLSKPRRVVLADLIVPESSGTLEIKNVSGTWVFTLDITRGDEKFAYRFAGNDVLHHWLEAKDVEAYDDYDGGMIGMSPMAMVDGGSIVMPDGNIAFIGLVIGDNMPFGALVMVMADASNLLMIPNAQLPPPFLPAIPLGTFPMEEGYGRPYLRTGRALPAFTPYVDIDILLGCFFDSEAGGFNAVANKGSVTISQTATGELNLTLDLYSPSGKRAFVSGPLYIGAPS